MYYRGARAHWAALFGRIVSRIMRIYYCAYPAESYYRGARAHWAALFGRSISASCRSITAKFGRIVLLRRAGPLCCRSIPYYAEILLRLSGRIVLPHRGSTNGPARRGSTVFHLHKSYHIFYNY
jgi:hypothetical protein